MRLFRLLNVELRTCYCILWPKALVTRLVKHSNSVETLKQLRPKYFVRSHFGHVAISSRCQETAFHFNLFNCLLRQARLYQDYFRESGIFLYGLTDLKLLVEILKSEDKGTKE